MLHLIKLGLSFWAGYALVTKAAPVIQAKVEAMHLDEMWDVFNEEAE